eukprot:1544610-Prymnesium_polylepis.5
MASELLARGDGSSVGGTCCKRALPACLPAREVTTTPSSAVKRAISASPWRVSTGWPSAKTCPSGPSCCTAAASNAVRKLTALSKAYGRPPCFLERRPRRTPKRSATRLIMPDGSPAATRGGATYAKPVRYSTRCCSVAHALLTVSASLIRCTMNTSVSTSRVVVRLSSGRSEPKGSANSPTHPLLKVVRAAYLKLELLDQRHDEIDCVRLRAVGPVLQCADQTAPPVVHRAVAFAARQL